MAEEYHAQLNLCNVLGGGRASFGALASGAKECSNLPILVASRSHALNGISKCVLNGLSDNDYSLRFADESYKSLDHFLDDMKNTGTAVGAIPCDSMLFLEMVKKGNGGVWFSACREGLYETYIPLMEEHITKPTYICVFDNDKQIADTARKKCRNKNIHFYQCIVHSVCSDIRYEYSKREVHLMCGKECLLVFPPALKFLSSEFRSDVLGGRAQFQFTNSVEEFSYFSTWKAIGINALHTLAAIKAYIVGTSKGLSLSEISLKCFADLVSENEMLEYLLRISSILYDKHLASYADIVEMQKEELAIITRRFIKGLYSRQEVIGRGLSPSHSSFESKLEYHIPLLKSSEDHITINMIDDFFEILNDENYQ